MAGGYYAVDLSPSVMLISLNGMNPFYSNRIGLNDVAPTMLSWVNSVLQANPNKKFMTLSHVFFGNNYFMYYE